MNLLIADTVGNAIGISGIIIGLMVAAVVHYRERKEKKPVYSMETINVVNNRGRIIDDIHVFWKDQEVPNLSITRIYFYNEGNLPIVASDVLSNNPLRLEMTSGCKILEYSVTMSSQKDNEITLHCSSDGKRLDMQFVYLDPKDRFIVTIYHTALNSEDINLLGKIVGVPKILRKIDPHQESSKDEMLFAILSSLFSLLLWFGLMFNWIDFNNKFTYVLLFLVLVGFVISVNLPQTIYKMIRERFYSR